ncbi:MAG: DUF6194 family protein [Actinocatenispora sp.]
MTQDEIIDFVAALPGVATVTAGAANGAPELAWGDTFFYYDPDDLPADRRIPFATIVTKDYAGFDTASDLNRPGVFRVNIAVGRARFEELTGHPPATHADHADTVDHTAADRVLPHPVYAAQAWVSVVDPGAATDRQVRSLLDEAHARAVDRHRPHR